MESRESAAAPPPLPGMRVGPPNSYNPNLPPNSAANTMMQNPPFPFNSVPSKPLDSFSSPFGDGSQSSGLRPGGFSIEPARKKRGRPRKYSPDGNFSLGLTPTPVTPISSAGPGDSSAGHGDSTRETPTSEATGKRSRGRPPGSGKKQLDALGSSGVGFTPHVILVKTGEDVASKIMAFSQQGSRTVCILSANGAICNVTLRQPAMGGTVTYEGRFEIISLSGSLSLSESNGNHSRIGVLTVSLAGSDGRVLGGGVAGTLTAASPVQVLILLIFSSLPLSDCKGVIVGSFIADGKKSKSALPSAPPPNILNFGAPVAAASPPSQGASSESSDENGSLPFSRGPGLYNNASQPIHNMQMYSNMGWGNSR
ncbi:hypothetical protein F0562_012622 [Nyssa sinensis]|uniref:AT-hook motif nuclear-localized protein n=1 Tax=Nyssa sinensis TaxID=561372 RepID=A0A5J4ZW25_9ASTE|nr:hypothetical protein F0562_012622 [Nyssa sinensis]